LSASGSAVFKIGISEQVAVTAKVEMPAHLGPETPVLILAHGANNDLDHPLLAAVATHLSQQAGTTVVRFNFPYMERGAGSPDAASVLENTFRRVHDHVADELAAPGAPIFIGGKSLGGRTAAELISRGEEGEGLVAAGLVELGYPLHRPGHKENLLTEPLRKIGVPSLFCIGEHDPFCDPELLRPLLEQLLHPGRLYVVAGGDHSLHRAGAPKSGAGAVGGEGGPAAEFEDVLEEVAHFVREVAFPQGA
jgi:predicted alpha/beta-hydrolase family hydrolase